MKTLTPRQRVSEAVDVFFEPDKPARNILANIVLGWEIVESETVTETMATDGPAHLFYNPQFVASLTFAEGAWLLLHEAAHVWLGHHLRFTADMDRMDANVAADLALDCLIKEECPSREFLAKWLVPGQGSYKDMPLDQEMEFYYRKIRQAAQQKQQQQSQQQPQQGQQGQDSQGGGQGEQGEPEQGDQEEQGQGDGESPEGEQEEQDQDSQGSGQPQDKPEQPTEGKDSQQGQQDSPKGQPAGQKGQSGEQSGDSQGQGESQQGQTTPGQGQQQGSQGQPAPGQGKAPQAASLGEVLPCPDCDTPDGQAEAVGQWQNVVAESLAIAQTCGNLPGWLVSLGEKMLGKSGIDWRTALRRFLTKAAPQGMTYQRPARRHAWRKDVIMPAHRSRGAGDGAFIADVSGSIFAEINDRVLPEIEKILMTVAKRSAIDLFQVDTELRDTKRFTAYDMPLRMPVEWKGGGGTNLCPAIDHVARNAHKYKYCVIITDCFWSYQTAKAPNGLPVLWIVINNSGLDPKSLPFGQAIKVDKE